MIHVERTMQPDILAAKAGEWTQALLNARSPEEKKKREAKYAHPKVKAALVALFKGKCAYCESKVTHVDYGHIEHYRPKSDFPQLTFEWNNLLLACAICNGPEHKGNKFPENKDGGPIVNPCADDPAKHFNFVYDSLAQLATVTGKTQRGRLTENLLGLNRTSLRAHRSLHVRKLYALSSFAETDAEARSLLVEAKKADAEYAAFARAL